MRIRIVERHGRRAALALAVMLAGAVTAQSAAAMDEDASPDLREAASGDGAGIGRIEFMGSCAQCHGISGRGDGIIADYLTGVPPDLTTIQRDSDGVFPAGILYEIIEGGGGVGAHGSREMPAWGDRYAVEAYAALGWPHDPQEREAFIRARILALVEYLAEIQVE